VRSTVAHRPSVALLDFAARKDEPRAYLGTAIAELMRAELSAGGGARVVGGDAVARALYEVGVKERPPVSRQEIRALRRRLGVDLVVLGFLSTTAGGPPAVELDVYDGRAREPVVSLRQPANESEPQSAAAQLSERLALELGLGTVDQAARARAARALPRSPEALRLYAEGLAAHRRFDDGGARARWHEALALEPQQPWLHAALSLAEEQLGNRAHAAAEAARAAELAGELAPTDRTALQARADALAERWSAAVSRYQTLRRALPDDLSVATALAAVEQASGDAKAARQTLLDAHRLPEPLGDDPALDLAESRAALRAADWSRARVAANAAARGATARGALLVAAAARRSESAALLHNRDALGALAAAEEALQLAERVGDPDEETEALSTMGAAEAQAPDLESARQTFTQALERARARGNPSRIGRALVELAAIDRRQDRRDQAVRHFLDAAHAQASAGERAAQLASLRHAVELLVGAGKLSDSDDVIEQWLSAARRAGERADEAEALVQRARVRLAQARPDEAVELAGLAHTLAREQQLVEEQRRALEVMAQIRLAEGALDGARRSVEACLALAGAPSTDCLGTASAIALYSGDVAAARHRAEEAAAARDGRGPAESGQLALAEAALESHELRAVLAAAAGPFGARDDELRAQLLTARGQLASRRARDAQATVERALKLVHAEEVRPWLAAQLVEAEVASALGELPTAAATLARVLDEAQRRKLVLLALEAELAADTIELARGDRLAAHGRLEALRRRANALGIGLIAHKASAIMANEYSHRDR
jgi:hypothetical protein